LAASLINICGSTFIAANYGPDAESLVRDAIALYQQEKDKVSFLVQFIEFFSKEGTDTFGFILEARKVLKMVREDKVIAPKRGI